MADARQNRLRIFLDSWLARIGSVFGWLCLAFWGILAAFGFGEMLSGGAKETADLVMPIVCLALAVLHVLMIRSARKTKALIADFRVYCAVFAGEPDKSIPEAAKTVNEPLSAVQEKLKEMCRRGYFNGYIDHRTQRMVFPGYGQEKTAGGGLTVICCPGCGASNAVSDKGGTCRYCGAPLNPPSHLDA